MAARSSSVAAREVAMCAVIWLEVLLCSSGDSVCACTPQVMVAEKLYGRLVFGSRYGRLFLGGENSRGLET